MQVILRKTRLRWLRHTLRQTLTWFPKNDKRVSGRPKKSWSYTWTEDLQSIELACRDFREITNDRPLCRNCVAQYVEGLRTKLFQKSTFGEKRRYTFLQSG